MAALLEVPRRDGRSPLGAPDAQGAPLADRGNTSRWLRARSLAIGVAVLAMIVAAALAAPLLAPADPNHAFRDGGLTPNNEPVGPSARFPLGTDHLGRDYLSRLLHGARASLAVGFAATAAAVGIGVFIGTTAALAGTPRVRFRVPLLRRRVSLPIPVEGALMRITDAALALPAVLLAIALGAVFRPSIELTVFIVAAFMWTPTARLVYATARGVLARDFIEAARAIGVSPLRIGVRHVLPHISPVVFAYVPLTVAAAVLFEATLSYLGVGVPPPAPAWGAMIAEHASYYDTDPRLILVPGAALAVTLFALNLVGDSLRDAIDPRLAGRPA